jgi:FkbM family methyltransferase
MEIGSLHGNDCKALEDIYHTGNVRIMEAHPIFFERIKIKYPEFSVFNIAGSDIDGMIDFNCIDANGIRTGISSMLDRNNAPYVKQQVMARRMDSFISEHDIFSIDMLKIDVEGCSYQVLKGFGDKLNIVKSIHVENEHISVWKNQKTYIDVEKLLIDSGFIMAAIKIAWPQSDSVWIRKDLFNHLWWK